MSKQYSPKNFFRNASNKFLQQYFSEKNISLEISFDQLTETKIDPLYDEWLKLPEDIRKKTEQNFQEIDELATEAGIRAIIDEANYHGENLAEKFSELESDHDRAFWAFLNHKECWNGASLFNHADTIPPSYWRKRKNIPRTKAKTDTDSIKKLEAEIGNYFYYKQGRGKNCKIECYRRHDLDYYYAYPEDYSQASVEWENQEFKRRLHHPAFEVIFVYSQSNGTLDVYLSKDRKLVPDLQEIFAKIILQTKLKAADKDEQVYNLNQLLSRNFRFIYNLDSVITNVTIETFRLKIHGTNDHIVLRTNSRHNKFAIFDHLEKNITNPYSPQNAVTQVEIKVTYIINHLTGKTKLRKFTISYPNSCSLKQYGIDLTIRKMLKDSNIELQDISDIR